jgi:hypothetical protein
LLSSYSISEISRYSGSTVVKNQVQETDLKGAELTVMMVGCADLLTHIVLAYTYETPKIHIIKCHGWQNCILVDNHG